LEVKLVRVQEKDPTPDPLGILDCAMVGAGEVLQQTPLSVMIEPPSEVICPPVIAEVCVIVVAGVVVIIDKAARVRMERSSL
jgi:hypothetical protein